jgi:murein DD-endopeptidase MepM/ murein hydrolase activator NlpD
MFPSLAPTVSRTDCRTSCAGIDVARAGSTVRVIGRNLELTTRVVLLGARGSKDDVAVKPKVRKPSYVEIVVPARARSGAVRVVNRDGLTGDSPKVLAIATADAGTRLASAGPGLVDARVVARKVFFAGRSKAQLSYLVKGSQPLPLRVELVHLATKNVVRSWDLGLVAPQNTYTLTWNGLAGGKVPDDGRYQFRIYVTQANGKRVRATAAQTPSGSSTFDFLRHIFPVRGRHDYGQEGARFGAGREGHTHQGQDVMAACGTPLVAARGGTVQYAGVQSAAGNYLVIDGDGTSVDYAYMHLRDAVTQTKGQKVFTGEVIGYVGDTGDASACHLHFEMWAGPGWYEGGSPFDPLPSLLSWDRLS